MKKKVLLGITEAVRLSLDGWFLEKFVNHLSENFEVDLVMDYDISKPEEIETLKVFKKRTSASKLFALSARREPLDFKKREELTHIFKKSIEDLKFPNSNYYYWQSLAYDEYYGSMENLRYKAKEVIEGSKPHILLLPIVSVISSTGRTEVMISPLVFYAKKEGIPVAGYKSAGFIDRNFAHLYASYDFFLVHTPCDVEFLKRIGIEEDRIFLLREQFTWLTSQTINPQARIYWDNIKEFRKTYNIPEDAFVVASFHVFSHRRDAREIAKALLHLSDKVYLFVLTSKSEYRKTINNHDTALKYTFYDVKEKYGERLIIEDVSYEYITSMADAIVAPADLGGNVVFSFDKPVVIYNVSLPGEFNYKNVLYTHKPQTMLDFLRDYIKNRYTIKDAIQKITKSFRVKA